MERIINHKFTIDEAFAECFYIVPDYQREYVWKNKQINQLLEDIDKQIDASSSEYFIGMVLVSPTDDKKHFDVIDGQQRLTTIFLILCALRVLFKETPQGDRINELMVANRTDKQGNIEEKRKLEPRYENAAEVIENIIQTNGDPQAVRAEIQSKDIKIYGSIENILAAYDVIYRFLTRNYDDEAKLKKYWGHLANNVVFIQISTNVSSALKIFETINERGVGLNPMDLLKNLLFTHVSLEDFPQLRDEWKKITSPLEQNKEKPLRFLRYFLMASYNVKNDRSDAIVREDEIYDWFSKKENAELTKHKTKSIDFVRQIIRNVERYIDFSKGLGNDGKQSFAVESLEKLTRGAFSLHYVLLLAAAKLQEPLFDKFVSQLESFLFYYIFTKTPTRRLESNFSMWADKMRDITCLETQEEQSHALNQFIADYFENNLTTKIPDINDALKRLTLDSTRQYRTKYLLARLAQHVDMAFKGQENRGSLDPYFELEIEHILPNTPSDDLRDAWEKKHSGLNYDEIKKRLGNLTLLEKTINAAAGNKPYSTKRSLYAESQHYLTKSMNRLDEVGKNTSITRINKKLCAFDTWDAEDIEKRQSLLIELIRDIWKTTNI